jgi:HD-GYP domain-containing protein (c-di-GMP phosphodiesterase class II)
MREAHESTIRGVARALEALDPFTRGHAERVAQFCEVTAGRLGLDVRRRDLLRWAAYVHDIGKVAVPLEMLRAHRPLEPAEEQRMIRLMAVAEDVMADVGFLAPVVDVVRGRHALLAGGGDALQPVEARILAAADLFDTLTSARSYRAAVTQPHAFAELRAASDRLGGEVVEALLSAIRDSGEIYGSPDEESTAMVDRLVKERAIRA